MSLPGAARFFVVKNTVDVLSNRTAETVLWSTVPTVNDPAGVFTYNTGARSVEINVPGIYWMNSVMNFANPANPSEWFGLWLQRWNGSIWDFDDYFVGSKGNDISNSRLSGSIMRNITQSSINAGTNLFRVVVYQAQVSGTTLNYGETATFSHWDIVRLDGI